MPFKRGTIDSDDDEGGNAPAGEEDQEAGEDVPVIDEADEEDGEKEEAASSSKERSKGASSSASKNADAEAEEDDDADELGGASSSKRKSPIDQAAYIPSSVVPSSLRGLRACLLCALVKTADQFETSGCDNCERFLQLRGNRPAVLECTSSSFDGLVMLMSPSESWVAKWLRWDRGCVPGAYAVSVTGQLPPEIISELEEHGYRYVSRDTSLRA